jgi:hypothetical protein
MLASAAPVLEQAHPCTAVVPCRPLGFLCLYHPKCKAVEPGEQAPASSVIRDTKWFHSDCNWSKLKMRPSSMMSNGSYNSIEMSMKNSTALSRIPWSTDFHTTCCMISKSTACASSALACTRILVLQEPSKESTPTWFMWTLDWSLFVTASPFVSAQAFSFI